MTIYSIQENFNSISGLLVEIRDYWNEHIHDLEIATHPIGSPGFFQELDEYRFEKLNYLPKRVNFSAYSGKELLEVGCGVGIDLIRFARGGATVTGVDLSETAIELAHKNFQNNNLNASLYVMNGEALEFPDNSFDVIYAHGVLQYTASAQKMVAELYRVLKSGGSGIFMVYNKYSWLNALSKFTKVDLEHEDAPAFNTFSIIEFRSLLKDFSPVRIIPERFPVRTRLHKGWKASLYNEGFVRVFNWLPRVIIKPLGWHLMAIAEKA